MAALILVVALLHLGDHHLDGDHGVVDQKAERDDERAERDALQRDAGELHRHEGDGEHQRDGHGDDDARPPAERQEAHRQHDGDRLHRLLVNSPTASLTTCGWSATRWMSTPIGRSRDSSATLLLDGLAERQGVAARGHRDRQDRSPAAPLKRNIGCGGST